jgi:hypothetical protein
MTNSHSLMFAFGMLRLVVLYACIGPGEANGRSSDNWSREPFYELKTANSRPLTFLSVSSIDGHLIAHCGYIDLRNLDATAIPGIKRPESSFWPDVTLAVADNPRGHWVPIGVATKKGKRVTVSILPHDTNTILSVDLDPFRPMITKWSYGKIVLPNGEFAIFALKYLLPPS